MNITPDDIDTALDALENEISSETVQAIRPILLINLNKKRIHTFLENETGELPQYILRVVDIYSKNAPFLHELQIKKSSASWEKLRSQLQQKAFHYFCRKNFRPDSNTTQIALDCATDTLLGMVNAHYPYDVDFDAWAYIFLLNICRKRIGSLYKQRLEIDKKHTDINDLFSGIADENSQNPFNQQALRQDLEKLINQLTLPRQEVIRLKYFEHKSNQEIAHILNKSTNAVYKLHFDAIAQLRKILQSKEDNYE